MSANDVELRIGFIGVGFISRMMIEGLELYATQTKAPRPIIHLSPRSKTHVQALLHKFPDCGISVCQSEQEVVDKSDVVVVALPPKVDVFVSVVGPLSFRASQTVINVTSAIPREALMEAVAPAIACHAVPLPAVSTRRGTTIVSPACATAERVFQQLGSVTVVETAAEANALMTCACQMGPFYQLLRTSVGFLTEQNIDKNVAADFVANLFVTIASDMVNHSTEGEKKKNDETTHARGAERFEELVAEQTPGGLNERAIAQLTELGVYDAWRTTQAAVYDRLMGNPVDTTTTTTTSSSSSSSSSSSDSATQT